jgi:hypothetical protein
VADIFKDNDSEIEYFNEGNKEYGGNVVSGMQFETENTETEDVNLVAGWQIHVDPESVKEDERSDTDIQGLPRK